MELKHQYDKTNEGQLKDQIIRYCAIIIKSVWHKSYQPSNPTNNGIISQKTMATNIKWLSYEEVY